MGQDRQGESPQQPGSPSNQWSGPGGPEKEPPRSLLTRPLNAGLVTLSRILLNPPRLNIDRELDPNDTMLPRCRVERRVVWNLLLQLEAHGFTPTAVVHDEQVAVAGDVLKTMEEVFSVDECIIEFDRLWVKVVLGNYGTDCLSDWGWTTEGPGAEFSLILRAFNPEALA